MHEVELAQHRAIASCVRMGPLATTSTLFNLIDSIPPTLREILGALQLGIQGVCNKNFIATI